MTKTRIPDQAQRDRIVTALDTTFLVEAGAGSGKTKSLVDRMLALLREGKCEIQTLAAVTFTRKAAAELRGRFQTELEENIRHEQDIRPDAGGEKEESLQNKHNIRTEKNIRKAKDPAVKQRLETALRNLEQCYIGTIHSFCARILRERPIEIALDPEFKDMEEIEDAIYREACWYDYLLKARLEDEETLARLEHAGLAPEDLHQSFTDICRFPEVELMGGDAKPPHFDTYRTRLEYFLAKARKEIPLKEPERGFDQLQLALRRCFMREKVLGFDDHRLLMETFELLDRNLGIRKTLSWPTKEDGEAFKQSFDTFRREVVEPALKRWREYRHSVIMDFIKPAAIYYAERRKAQSRVNFEDLLMLTAKLLRKNPEIRRYFRRKYTHILVDEFQDTDPIQAEVLLYLTGTDCEETDWRKVVPHSGSLFLVGDPKQSIFRFRRADIDIYNLVKDQIVKAGGEVLPLTANFRSMDPLRDWINPLFERVFPEHFDRYQAAYAPLHTLRPVEGDETSGVFKITIPKMEGSKKERIAEYDANAIGDYILWALDGNLKLARSARERQLGLRPEATPSDFMLIFRYKKLMHFYARALEERGIPYEITGGGAFKDTDEVREILNLVNALNDPENPIYTVAVLRGNFFGCSDNELLNFKRNGGRFSFLSRGIDDNGNGGPQSESFDRVMESLDTLREWWQWTRDLPPSTALEKIFEASGIFNYLVSADLGSSKAGNLFKLLAILRGQEREGETSFARHVAFMDELVTLHEIEEMSLTPGRTDAVRLMNLHKAKGLEAPVVFLANPSGVPEWAPDRHVSRTDEKRPQGYFLFSKPGVFRSKLLAQPVGWDRIAAEEKLYQEAEEMRLMYVAATRPRNILVVSHAEKVWGDHRAWALLDRALESVPELEIPPRKEFPPKQKVVVKEGEWEEARQGLTACVAAANTPSYRVETVTAVATEGTAIPARQRTGQGMSWGRVVHSVMDAVGKDRNVDIDWLIDNALAVEERDPAERRGLRILIELILASEFWQRAMQSERRLFEVPFSIRTSERELGHTGKQPGGIGKELGGTEKEAGGVDKQPRGAGNLPVILSGAIDLAFKEANGWVIADYKTDEIKDDLQAYVDYYAPQVRLYSKFWREISGDPVRETGLYFTSISQWVKL